MRKYLAIIAVMILSFSCQQQQGNNDEEIVSDFEQFVDSVSQSM